MDKLEDSNRQVTKKQQELELLACEKDDLQDKIKTEMHEQIDKMREDMEAQEVREITLIIIYNSYHYN